MNINFSPSGPLAHGPHRRLLNASLFSLAFLIAPLAMAQTAVRIDLSKPGLPVSPNLYGLMTEEINLDRKSVV